MITLSTGTDIDTYGDVIGISADGKDIFSGYDDRSTHIVRRGGKSHKLTSEEKRELAEVMIARWCKFGQIDTEPAATEIPEAIAKQIEAHAREPQVMVPTSITDTPRNVLIRECAAIARMFTAPPPPPATD